MAKAPPNQEHRAIRVLRENIKILMRQKGMSYDALAQSAGVPETVGRTINNLVIARTMARVDLVAPAADGLHVEMWQLFVPDIGELHTDIERKQLQRLVETFIDGGEPMRRLLNATLDVHAPISERDHQRHKNR